MSRYQFNINERRFIFNRIAYSNPNPKEKVMSGFTEEEAVFFLQHADENIKEINEHIEYLTKDMLRSAEHISGLRKDKEKLESMVSKLRSCEECACEQ